MRILIDYYLKDKHTGKYLEILHDVLTDNDVIEYALQKLKNEWDSFDKYDIDVSIDKIEV